VNIISFRFVDVIGSILELVPICTSVSDDVRPYTAKYKSTTFISADVSALTNKFISHRPPGINGVAFNDVILHAKFAIVVVPVERTDGMATVSVIVGLIDICE
jgi:hypothetical protein